MARPPTRSLWFVYWSFLMWQIHAFSLSYVPCFAPLIHILGLTVRFAPNSISFNSITAVDSIYRSRKANIVKSDWYQCVRDSAGGFESTFTARNGVRHGIKRRLLSHAFSEKALKGYEPRIRSLVLSWLDCLRQESKNGDEGVDMGDWCDYLIFDILGDLCFGKAFGVISSSKDRSVVGLVSQATKSWYTLGYHPLTHILRFLLFRTRLGPMLDGKSFRDNARFRSFCLKALRERRAAETSLFENSVSHDMFHHLLNGRDPETGQAYSTGDLACESVLLIVAGSQSTSCALAAVIFYLTHNQDALARLTLEIREAFASESEIRYDLGGKLGALPYLRACLDESMRLTPPTPGHLPREILNKDGLSIDGDWFPPHTDVGTSAYTLHRNEAYYPQPDRFMPKRWIEHADSAKSQPNPVAAFNAFSAGPTGCIGKQLAYMELSLAVALLLWQFDLEVKPNPSANLEYRIQDVFVAKGEGPHVRLRSRSSRQVQGS